MKHYDQPLINTCHYNINNNFINRYYLNNKQINPGQCSPIVILHLFMGDRVFTGWTNAAGSVEISNTVLPFHDILHFNMNLMK